MFVKILSVLGLILAALVVAIASRPDTFHYSRSITVDASAESVFSHVNDLRRWEAWSPWAKLDPAMQKSYEGPAFGVGAMYKWSGNNEVGEGSMRIIESRPYELVRMKLEFLRPFKGSNNVIFTFSPQGGQTLVTWAMSGKNNFISKAVDLIMNCEKMIHGQFDSGLANLKSVVENKV